MNLFAPSFLLGMVIIFHLTHLPAIIVLIAVLLGNILLYFLTRKKFYLLPLIIIFGGLYATMYGHYFVTKFIPHNLENKKWLISGYITNLPERKSHYDSFHFTTDLPNHQKITLQLAWSNPYLTLHPGQKWQLLIKAKQPHTLANPGGFDAEAFAIEQGISGKGYVINSTQNKLLTINNWHAPISSMRDFFRQKIMAILPTIHAAVFIPALSIGDRELVSPSDWAILQATGTNHLIAISGLHIGLLSGLIFFLTRRIWKIFPALIIRAPINIAAATASIIIAIFYSALAGFALPTQRALVMLICFMLSLCLRKYIPAWYSYWLAMLLVLLLNPAAVLSASFWLSFAAVGSIIWMLSYRKGNFSRWQQNIKLQIAVSLGVIPCTILFFHNASIISPIANAIVVPWVGLIVVPLSLLGTCCTLINVKLAGLIFYIAAYAMQLAWWFLEKMAALPYSSFSILISHPIDLGLLCIGIFLLTLPKGFTVRYLSAIFILPIFFPYQDSIAKNSARLTVLEVGQGLSCIIQTAHHHLIYDTGPAQPDGFDAGRDVVALFLQYSGIKKIDTMIISHGDNDHSGGAFYLLQHFPIQQIITSSPKLFNEAHLPIQECVQQHWQWDGVNFDLFANPVILTKKKNNLSCILRVSVGQQHILLPGDIEKSREHQVIGQNEELTSDILLAPHHGSITSSSDQWVNSVHPKIVIFSTGYLNRFHFPNPIIMDRYRAIGAKLFNTADTGMIQLNIAQNNSIKITTYREIVKNWWR